MKGLLPFRIGLAWLLIATPCLAEDPGKEAIARLTTQIIFATNESIENAEGGGMELSRTDLQELQKMKHKVSFKNFSLLGSDTQPVLLSYENWARPIKNSSEILVSFQPKGRLTKGNIRLDLELWQSQRKVMKTDVDLTFGKHIYILGPKWRTGRLIISLGLQK